MKNLFVMFAVVFSGFNVFAYSSGTMTCHFDLMGKKNWPKIEKTPEFEFDVMEEYQSSIESKYLDRSIHFRYNPGIVSQNNVQIAVVTMTYAGADAGADVPLVPNGQYSFNIGRQDSDLVGAFMVCTVKNLK